MTPRRLLAASTLAMTMTLTGCSSDAPPSESAPELATRLDRVDAAIESGDYDRARAAVEALVAATAKAQVAGRISDDEADRILDAARDVLAELPEEGSETPATDPTTTPTPQIPTPTTEILPPDQGGHDEDEGKDEDGEKKKDDKGRGGGKGEDD